MKSIFALIVSICFTFLSTIADAKVVHKIPNDNRTLYVTGVIDFSAIKIANAIERASAAKSAPIHLVINSPGGIVDAGKQIIQAMDIARQRGSDVICSVGVIAASMAFQLLSHCTERYALKNSLLLFHPARVFIRDEALTADQAAIVSKELKKIDVKADLENIEMMKARTKWYLFHNKNETLWNAEDLVNETSKGWLSIVDEIDAPHGIFNLSVRGQGGSNLRNSIKNGSLPWVTVIIKEELPMFVQQQ